MRTTMIVLLGAVACKGTPTETDVPVDCSLELTRPLQQIAVPEWPEGMEAALTTLTSLDGRYTAEACGDPVNVSIRTPDPTETGTMVDVLVNPLPAGHDCGCTIDRTNPKDGDSTIIGYSTMDLFVDNYPNPGFRDENAGNVSSIPVALFAPGSPQEIRGCTTELVPPILGLAWTDTDVVFRATGSSISADVRMWGANIGDDTCQLTNWVRVGDN